MTVIVMNRKTGCTIKKHLIKRIDVADGRITLTKYDDKTRWMYLESEYAVVDIERR